jgi:hypothetical protein
MLQTACRLITPKGVDIDNGVGSVTLFGHHNFDGFSSIVYELMSSKEIIPTLFPTNSVVSPLRKHPIRRVVSVFVSRPRPDHIRMKQRNKGLCVLIVPRIGFKIYQGLYRSLYVFHDPYVL